MRCNKILGGQSGMILLETKYHTVKNVGCKKLWRIRTVGSLAKELWQIEVHACEIRYVFNAMD